MIGDSIGAAVGAEKQRKQSKKELREAKYDRERAVDMAANANYNPFLVSDVIDPYQRSQSPVARGYLESFLTGANPQTVQGTRANAAPAQQAAQGQFNQAYGGWDQLRAQQREMEQSTPWDIKPFKEAPVSEEMRWNAKYGSGGRAAMAQHGLSYDDLAKLEAMGITIDPRKGTFDGQSKAADREVDSLNIMQKHPNNAGMLEEFLSQVRSGQAGPKTAQEMVLAKRRQPWEESRTARVFGGSK